MRWLPVSATAMVSDGSTASARGALKVADVPVAESAAPADPLPASVLT